MFPFLTPLTSLFLLGGSTLLNTIAANKQNAARDAALGAERQRQKQLDAEAAALNNQSRERYTDFEGQQADAGAQLGDYFTKAPQSAEAAMGEANVSAAGVMPSATNDIVTQEIAKQTGRAKAFTDQQGTARGNLRAFGDLLGGISLDQARDAGQVAQIGGFKAGSSGVLPYELDAAARKGAGLQLFGDLLGGIGSIGLNAGITQGVMNGTMNLPSWLGGAAAASPVVGGGLGSVPRPKPRPSNLGGLL